jgi:hypothetical protein
VSQGFLASSELKDSSLVQSGLPTPLCNISQRPVSLLYSILEHTKNLLLFVSNSAYELPIKAKIRKWNNYLSCSSFTVVEAVVTDEIHLTVLLKVMLINRL